MKTVTDVQNIEIDPCSIVERMYCESSAPVVSILCLTYNHEKFIRDCLDGFLMQETVFPVEILVHDDASTDATREIIRDYERRYARLFRNVLQNQNQFSLNNNPVDILTPMARGRYIARCEGDDFWTDPHKLQIQVDFLEGHPDYVVSGHGSYSADETGLPLPGFRIKRKNQQDCEREDLILNKRWLALRSLVYRNVISSPPPEKSMVENSDNFLLSLLGQYGKGKFHAEIKPACYRIHSGGIWSMKSDRDKNAMRMNTFYWMFRYYHRINEPTYAAHYFRLMTRRSAELIDTVTLVRKTLERITGVRGLRNLLRYLRLRR
ncbi:glycosyltransferase [Verrucomicrobiales bacterium]|nr:glycosyltransferase [Verrucomicrobiales bacterium]